ncbi:hypothetical protein ACH4GM_24725 [Streptomyces coeruleorubidus]|uniref:hypothetical protein n=1 Tax=Streptomyces coeruleorubidus TaxID=116188 RepID=UPI0037917277
MTTVMATTEAPLFVDWTSREGTVKAIGKLGGRTATVVGLSGGINEVNTNGAYPYFADPSVFTPPLPASDTVGLVSKPDDSQFTVDFGAPVQDAVFHIGSLASIMTFEDATVTRLSGDQNFKVEQNGNAYEVKGLPKDGEPTDSNGTIRISKPAPFSSVTFKLRLNFSSPGGEEGVYLQIGRTVRFVDWTSREGTVKAIGKLGGRTATVVGPSGGINEVNTNGAYPYFADPSVFTPPLPASDTVGLVSKPDDSQFTVDFGAPVQDAVFHIGSLASIMTFEDATVTRLSGDQNFKVEQNGNAYEVKGLPKDGEPTDSNGTIRISKPAPFKSVTFKLRLNFSSPGGEEGVYLQIGR